MTTYFQKSLISLTLLGLFLVSVTVASASTVIRSGESISIDKDQKIDGDFYAVTSIFNFSGEVSEDLVALGGEMTLNGVVAHDITIVGGNVDMHATVGDDLRIVGGNVIVAGPVAENVLVLGGKVSVLSTAAIGGDLIVYGGDVEISGPVAGDVVGTVESLRIDAPIGGAVDVTTEALTIGDRAEIAEGVRYIGTQTLTRSPNAKIGGEVTRNDPATEIGGMTPRSVLIPVLIVLFSNLIWYMIARSFLLRVVDRALLRSTRPLLTGAIVFFAFPLIAVVLMVTVLGILTGAAALFAYLLALTLAATASSVVIGQFVMDTFNKNKTTARVLSPVTLLVGVAVSTLCLVVPVVGPLLLFGFFIVTLGALIDVIIRPSTQA